MMKRILVVATLFLLLGGRVLNAQPTQSQGEQYQKVFTRVEKDPGKAFLYSMFIPGTGQMYNGDVALGLGTFFGTSIITGGSMLLGATSDDGKAWFVIGSIGGGVIYLGQLIYAPIRAKQLNDRYWKGQANLLLPRKDQKKTISLVLNPLQKKAGVVVGF
jgi:hypothetical protein